MSFPANAKGRHLIVWEDEEYEVPAPLVAYLEHLAKGIETVADQVKETQRALVTVAETVRHSVQPVTEEVGSPPTRAEASDSR